LNPNLRFARESPFAFVAQVEFKARVTSRNSRSATMPRLQNFGVPEETHLHAKDGHLFRFRSVMPPIISHWTVLQTSPHGCCTRPLMQRLWARPAVPFAPQRIKDCNEITSHLDRPARTSGTRHLP